MRSAIQYFINRPKVANLILFSIISLGFISMYRTNNSGYPAVDFGVVNITTIYPGASPEDVDLKVTSKIEDELSGISGIKQYMGSSIENLSQIAIMMEDSADYKEVIDDIQKAVDQVDDLPPAVTQRPIVQAVDNDRIPVIEISLTGQASEATKRQYAKALERELKTIPDVGLIYKLGYRKREVQIKADTKLLSSNYVSLTQIIQGVQAHNIRMASGELKSPNNEKKLIVNSEYKTIQDVKKAVIRSGFEGQKVLISDIAEVTDGYETPQKLYRVNGTDSINVIVQKRPDSDVIKTVEAIKEVLDEFTQALPSNVQASIIVDYSQEVKSLQKLVVNNGLMGLALILLILLIFLNFKVALWTSLGIPTSIFFGFIFFHPFDITINFISLMAVLIVLGLLVDDAIIVSENIFRLKESGMPPKEAAITGAMEVFWPVVTTVSTTIVAFLPLLAMTGVMGKFMYSMPIVITMVLLGSLFECLFILPSHMAHTKVPKTKVRKFKPFKSLEKFYKKLVLWTMTHKLKTVSLFLIGFVCALILLVTRMNFVLFDSSDGLYGIIRYELPIGSSLDATKKKSQAIENLLLNESPKIISSFVNTVGEKNPLIATFGMEQNHSALGNILIHLTPMGSREETAKDIMESLNRKLKAISGFSKLEAEVVQEGPPIGRPVTVSFIGNNDSLRNKLATELKQFLGKQPGVFNIEDNQGEGKKQIQFKLNYEKIGRLGLTPVAVANTLRTAYDGVVATEVRLEGEEVDYRVILKDSERTSLDTINRLVVLNNNSRLVKLGDVLTKVEKDDLLVVNHFNGDKSITIYSDLDTDVNTSLKVNNAIKEHFDPIIQENPGMRVKFGGEEEDTQEAMRSLFVAMILSLIGIYFILVILFNSFSQPFLVMIAIPFTLSGIIYTFYIHQLDFGFVAIIGLIGLTGIVVNDSLVMISFMNSAAKKPDASFESIADAAVKRFRPVVLTSLTTAAGLFPSAYGFGGDNAFLIPMILSIAWGIIFATVITLVLVPALYTLQVSVKRKVKHHVNRITSRRKPA